MNENVSTSHPHSYSVTSNFLKNYSEKEKPPLVPSGKVKKKITPPIMVARKLRGRVAPRKTFFQAA